MPRRPKPPRFVKRVLRWLLSCAALGVVIVIGLNWVVQWSSEGKVYSNVADVPSNKVALVLGTSPVWRHQPNPFFTGRMDAAAALFHSGRVQKLLLSGDRNPGKRYDEPGHMRASLIARGVPASDILIDPDGHRTFDSLFRAGKVYGLTKCTVISDDFHLPRALFLARADGLDAIGFASRPNPSNVAPDFGIREVGARVLMFWDIIKGPGKVDLVRSGDVARLGHGFQKS